MSRLSTPTRFRILTPALAALSLLSCTADQIDVPRSITASTARSAKGGGTGGGVTVNSASPAFGDQGTTVNVHVFGDGFANGAQATWLLHGAADAHVHTNSTTVVSSTELVANVTITNDAQIAFWDVQVALGGKNGVGSEAFEVTSAQILGPGTLGGGATTRGMNDLGQIVGFSATTAWVYDDAHSMVSLGAGVATSVDPLGTIIVGWNGDNLQTAWVRQPNDNWIPQFLPRPVGSVGGQANAVALKSDGTLLVGGTDDIKGARKSSENVSRPVAWLRGSDGAWSNPQFYQVPPGVSSATIQSINPLGQAVGFLDVVGGVVWDSPTSFVVLDGIARAINRSGTLIVGNRNNGPGLYWWRDPVTHAWHTTGVPLPPVSTTSCSESMGRHVNDAGVIVGWSCTTDGKKPTAWKLVLSTGAPVLVGAPTPLPGLGIKSSDAQIPKSAVSVTETAPYVVAGGALSTGSISLAVRWRLP